jgi:hypothetical protein
MMACDPVEVTPAISTATVPTTAIQHQDGRSATKDDTTPKFFGNERIFNELANLLFDRTAAARKVTTHRPASKQRAFST